MRKLVMLLLLGCFMVQSVWAQEVADIVKAYPRGKSIVVEYDLGADADFVRLFVSLDGGAIYRGPLQQVSGDIVDVKAGFGHSIVWDVLKEFDADAFENDQVRFKISLKMKERWPKETFVTFNAAYSFAPQGSFGFSVGQVRRFGWFVSLMSNGDLSGFSFDGDCDANGYLPGGHLMNYTGKTSKMRLSVMAGGMMRVTQSLMARVGVGYGNRTLRWQTTDGKWLRNTAFSQQGIDVSAGLQYHVHGFVVSLETVTTLFESLETKIGIGYAF
ncbi:MAG: hypothetical protein IKM95_03070 [Bacteroidales bacterium]|nr:hypothetical protein [Bacteroidales bacterium]